MKIEAVRRSNLIQQCKTYGLFGHTLRFSQRAQMTLDGDSSIFVGNIERDAQPKCKLYRITPS